MGTMALHAQRKKTRGAVVSKPREALGWSINWQHFLPLVAVLFAVGFAVVARQWLVSVTAIDVARVAVTGDMQYVDRKKLVHDVRPLLSKGFLFLDLTAIRAGIIAMPWVFDATVTRQWPDQIQIRIIEQRPIARWSDKGYLNHRGDFFPSPMMSALESLPLLAGAADEQSSVMENYRELSGALRSVELPLTALRRDVRGDWWAEVDSRITVALGSDLIMEKMQRFIRAYRTLLVQKIDQVKRIDMRYSRGFAVAWREEPVRQ